MLWTQVYSTKITNISAIGLDGNLLNCSKRLLLVRFFFFFADVIVISFVIGFCYCSVCSYHSRIYVLYTSEYTQLNGIRKYCAPFVADINVRLLLDTDTVQAPVRFTPFEFVFVQLQPITIFQLIRFYEPFCSFLLLSFTSCVCVCR